MSDAGIQTTEVTIRGSSLDEKKAQWPLVKKPHPPFYFGGFAACAANFFTHPLDLLKVRLQTAKGAASGNGLAHVVKGIYTEQGVLGFYNGISAAVLRQMTYSMARFATYESLKKHMSNSDGTLPFYRMAAAGVTAGAVGGICGTPAEIVLVRLQNDGSLPVEKRRNYKNAFDGLFRITREEGTKGLFKGAVPNVSRSMLMCGAQLCSYDLFKELLLSTPYFSEGMPLHFSASFLAGFVATTITSPFDVVKTRIMNAGPVSPYKNLAHALVVIVREEGPSALYKGWTPSFVRMAPQTILTFIFLEQFRELYWSRYAKTHSVRYE
ncbi:putative mitochondrial dicarboxylate carrier [Coemansia reversa NRRL 1564]|uniref:Putative mitochondrial dicarboxylate carrier n=1 Tax=Coemansia reversa (strain ATCC 12441 / NRRL 1564) TaxID=763665 RepID=A0A2G5B7T1_COERN|nr:putative mitochondrial dicarboxylate carrier [Coemansia reversa NRRL 1564]|eukprot:PIA15103.1 putative mitochondrial dicarboxylate carrier [Coemansia reversa NRRL 1564]